MKTKSGTNIQIGHQLSINFFNIRRHKIMMTIYFKNGMTKEVIKQIGEAINTRVIEGCGKFQTFSDENGNLLLIVNLDEVVYIA